MDNETKQVVRSEYQTSMLLLNDLLRLRREGNYVFRGISRKMEWNPTIQRYYSKGKFYNLIKYEYRMLYDFFQNWNLRHFNSSENILELVASAQHYGIPTRLVDWTRDPYVALYFAVNNNLDPDDGYYSLIYTNLNSHTVLDSLRMTFTVDDHLKGGEPNIIYNYQRFLRTIGDRKGLKELIESRNTELEEMNVKSSSHYSDDGLIFYDSPLSNERLLAQKGLFSIPVSLEDQKAANEIIFNTDTIKIHLDSKERDKLLFYLENMNYSRNYLFPDLQNLCRYIVDKTIKLADANEIVDRSGSS